MVSRALRLFLFFLVRRGGTGVFPAFKGPEASWEALATSVFARFDDIGSCAAGSYGVVTLIYSGSSQQAKLPYETISVKTYGAGVSEICYAKVRDTMYYWELSMTDERSFFPSRGGMTLCFRIVEVDLRCKCCK